MVKVFFLPIEKASMDDGFPKLLDRIMNRKILNPTDTVAVKIHPGEEGNSSYVSPDYVNRVIKALTLGTEQVFLTDTTVLYPGKRMSAPDYLHLTHEHGFGIPWTPPFIIADGLRGEDEILVKMPEGFQTGEAHIASIISNSDAMIVLSHFKGHLLTGFGGALKNLGMGCASRAGKL
ncbi:4Fe-4S ferredoxin, partial [Candidatus Fermentibacteria bacterium]